VTSLREAVRRLLGRAEEQQMPDVPDVALAYTFYWTKLARLWDNHRRAQVLRAVEDVMDADDFAPNLMERRYWVPATDDVAHAGASLAALRRVLQALEEFDNRSA
jgi:hypothetical protein